MDEKKQYSKKIKDLTEEYFSKSKNDTEGKSKVLEQIEKEITKEQKEDLNE